jgi:FtsP/CotA-like multicopper oxidase with cupredoxin domain
MQHAVPFPNAESEDLPTQGIAERYDIIVDFKGLANGTKLYLVNTLEHQDGKGPSRIVPLADIISGKYAGDPAVGKIMQFQIDTSNYTYNDQSMNPADYVEGKSKMIEMPVITAAELAAAHRRNFEFGRANGTDAQPWTIKTDGGQGLNADFQRVSADPTKGTLEVWTLKNGGSGWSHPVHIHFEEGRVLSRDGKAPPIWEKYARKDVYRIGSPSTQSSTTVEFALRVREFAGTYVEHCHNTQHEDNAMLLRWDIVNPGQTVMIPTPRQTWEGTFYEDSFKLVNK